MEEIIKDFKPLALVGLVFIGIYLFIFIVNTFDDWNNRKPKDNFN